MRIRQSSRVVAALAVLLLAAACSGGSKTGPDGSENGSANSRSGSRASSNPITQATLTPTAEPTELARPCDPVLNPSGNAGHPGTDYIQAATRPTPSWGPNCAILNPGDRCFVEWQGSYVVLSGDQAHLQFQAWLKGQKKPFKVMDLGPLPPENRIRNLGFPVTMPIGTEVAFRLVLMNSAKAPVAISDAYSYKLNCRRGPG